jgi:hypothetical protein
LTMDHFSGPGRHEDDDDAALDAALTAADEDMLAVISAGLDLDKGLARIFKDLHALKDLHEPSDDRPAVQAPSHPEEQPIDGIASMNASGRGASHRQLAAPAVVQAQAISRTADNAMDVSESLTAPGRDLRMMKPSGREETTAITAQLHELLRRCPAGALGAEASAMVLTRAAAVSEALIADRDERAALRLIRAAFPHLMLLGRRHPAAFEVRRARAEALCELGYYRRAEILLRRVSEDEQRVYGADSPRTALLLLWALMGSDHLQKAETGFRALEARLSPPQGTSTPMMWHLQCRYSWLLAQQGLDSESARGYDGVILNRSHELGADHPDTSDARHSKGKMLAVAGKGSQAVTLLQAVADDRARVQGDHHSDTLETLKYLHLARVQAEPRDDRILNHAIETLEQILRIQDNRHGPAYPMSRDTAGQLGMLLQIQDAIRSREPIPDLRQVPVPGEGQSRAIPLPSHSTAPWHVHPAPGEVVRS